MSKATNTLESPELQLLSQIAASLKELTGLVRFGVSQNARATLEDILTTDKDRTIYQMSTSTASSRQIAAVVGGSDRVIRDRWKKWAAAGIVEEDLSVPGRYCRIFDLQVFGLAPSGDGKVQEDGE